jgi:hypothetical protein
MFGWVSVNDRFYGGYILVFGILVRRWSGLGLRIEHERLPRKKCYEDKNGTYDRSTCLSFRFGDWAPYTMENGIIVP